MALQVWLPLLGDLTNNGIYNSTISNVNATITNSGKLGKCYTTNGSNAYITGTYTATANMSFCIWARFNASFAGHLIDARVNDVGYQPMYVESNRIQSGGSSGGYPNFYYTFSTGVWYHLCVVYTQNNVSLYVNGSLIGTSTGGKGYNYGAKEFTLCCRHSHNQYYIPADIQDFRIYDHALSPKEIEILSRGLVVHYPMTGGGRGGANLAKGTNTASTNTNTWVFSEATGGSARTIEVVDGVNCAKITRNTTTHSGWSFMWYNNWDRAAIEPDTWYTLSMDVIASGSGSIGLSAFMQTNATNSITDTVETIQATFNADNWSHLVYHIHTISSFEGKGTSQTIYMNCGYLTNVSVWAMMKNFHLEKGKADSSWIPHTSDSAYTSMGYNDTIEYDTSGYNNHGTKNGTITYSSDTARYSVSSYLNADTNYISRTEIPADTHSISFWIKFPVAVSSTYRVAFADHISKLAFGMINATTACCTCAGNNKKTFTISQFTVDKWYHIVVQYNSDKSDVLLYINGVAQTTRGNNDAWNHTTTTLMLGRRSTGSTINAYISDFRIYATALSATQVAELYNTAVSLSSNGALLGYEFVET